jgi:hypothetical protein
VRSATETETGQSCRDSVMTQPTVPGHSVILLFQVRRLRCASP